MYLSQQMERNKKVSVICFDPSFTAWGYCVFSQGQCTAVGVIKTSSESKQRRIRKGDDRIRRINEIATLLNDLLIEHNVKLMLCELPHGSQSASAAVMVGAVSGIVETLSVCRGIPAEYYSEGDTKQRLLHKRAASKDEMIAAIKKQYTIPFTGVGYRDEAIADAVAVYHEARYSSSSLKLLESV
jgi:Holliday junction resolvasome RuvABC endonuclease subunit